MAVLMTLAIVTVIAAVIVHGAASTRRSRPRRQNFFGDAPQPLPPRLGFITEDLDHHATSGPTH